MSYSHHEEKHFIHRTGWLRAAVLGANDGIISVTSLIMGMAASGAFIHYFNLLFNKLSQLSSSNFLGINIRSSVSIVAHFVKA